MTVDSSVPKTAGDKWPAPARRLTQTHSDAAEQKTSDQVSIPLDSLHLLTYALLTTALRLNRIRKALKYVQAVGFLAAVNFAVRCERLCAGRCAPSTGPTDKGKVMTFTRKNYDLQVLLRPTKSEL